LHRHPYRVCFDISKYAAASSIVQSRSNRLGNVLWHVSSIISSVCLPKKRLQI